MSLLIPNGFVQVTIPYRHALTQREAVITYGAEVGALGATPAELDEHLDAFTSSVTIDNSVEIGPVRGSFGTSTSEHVAMVGTQTFDGTSSGERLPSNCAVLVKKLTARGGRRGRGRLFLPWHVLETDVSETGTIDPADVANIQTEMNAWRLALSGGARSMYVLHESGGSTTPGAPDEVAGLIVDSRIATQRRRLR